MQITVNGEPHQPPTHAALALNERVVPRSALDSTQLQAGDALLIIQPTFGG